MVVIGADGFIGSAVVRAGLGAGAAVIACCAKQPWRLAGMESEPGLSIVDLSGWWEQRRIESLEPLIAGADAVALLAYQPPPDRSSAGRHEQEVNTAAAVAIGELAAHAGARLVFTSSVDVYGPWHEAPVTEETAPQPQTPYSEAKLEAEHRLARGPGSVLTLRLSTVYGPGEDGPRAVPSFIRAFLRSETPVLHGDGTDIRDYVHVDDIAAAILNGCLRSPLPGTINLGTGVGRSTEEVLRAVAAALEVEPELERAPSRGPSLRLVVDPALAVRELDFDPRREFGPALREEAAWLRDRRASWVAA